MRARARLRVLVVEDDRDTAEGLCLILRKRGHEVESGESGEAGVEAAPRFMPDVVVCDIGLGKGPDGLAVARSLRLMPGVRCARLIAFTSYLGLDRDVRDAGFEYYLQKPMDVEYLLTLVDTAPPIEVLGPSCRSTDRGPPVRASRPAGDQVTLPSRMDESGGQVVDEIEQDSRPASDLPPKR